MQILPTCKIQDGRRVTKLSPSRILILMKLHTNMQSCTTKLLRQYCCFSKSKIAVAYVVHRNYHVFLQRFTTNLRYCYFSQSMLYMFHWTEVRSWRNITQLLMPILQSAIILGGINFRTYPWTGCRVILTVSILWNMKDLNINVYRGLFMAKWIFLALISIISITSIKFCVCS